MNSMLGVLCCGGRGSRLGMITEYVSKALVPVFDRPAFSYGLEQLRASRRIEDVLILTNQENDGALQRTGQPTLIQDDAIVKDMFSGLAFIREMTGDTRPAVVMPCDNISSIKVDDVVDLFESTPSDLSINLRLIEDQAILQQIGVFEPETGTMVYRPRTLTSGFGVLAPYVVRPGVDLLGGDEVVINRLATTWRIHEGYWFDIGTPEELGAASDFLRTRSHTSNSTVRD